MKGPELGERRDPSSLGLLGSRAPAPPPPGAALQAGGRISRSGVGLPTCSRPLPPPPGRRETRALPGGWAEGPGARAGRPTCLRVRAQEAPERKRKMGPRSCSPPCPSGRKRETEAERGRDSPRVVRRAGAPAGGRAEPQRRGGGARAGWPTGPGSRAAAGPPRSWRASRRGAPGRASPASGCRSLR